MEIERKFLLRSLPDDLDSYDTWEIEQGYLKTEGCTLRIRKANDDCFLTFKAKTTSGDTTIAIENEELETEIPLQSYEALKQLVTDGFIHKTRTRIPYIGNHVIEVDVFHDALEGLVFAEIEYEDAEDAVNLPLPVWFGKDVSADRRFRNRFLMTMEEDELASLFDEVGSMALVLR